MTLEVELFCISLFYQYQYHQSTLPLLQYCQLKPLKPKIPQCVSNVLIVNQSDLCFEQSWCICLDTTDHPKMVKTKKATSSKGEVHVGSQPQVRPQLMCAHLNHRVIFFPFHTLQQIFIACTSYYTS